MSEEELENLISRTVKVSIEAELGQYKVPKEQHYKDHIFLTELREWIDDIKSSFWKSLVTSVVTALLLLLVIGFVAWISFKIVIGVGK